MKQYEVRIIIDGFFPPELTPQLTKEIRIETTEQLKEEGLSILVVTTEANDSPEAFHSGLIKALELLSFYSVITLNHFRVIQDDKHQISTSELTGDRELESFDPGYSVEYPEKSFIDYFMPFYPVVLKNGNEYLRTAMQFLYLGRFEDLTHITIVHCMVALEALLTLSGQPTEIGYKLSNRAAILLGKNTEERRKFRKEFSDFYNIRSRVIHGDFIELGAYGFGSLVAWTKKIILMFLGMAKNLSHKEIIDKIDDCMIDNKLLDDFKKEATEVMIKIETEQHKMNMKDHIQDSQ